LVTLAEKGKQAKFAVPYIIARLSDRDEEVRQKAVLALYAAQGAEAIPRLEQLLIEDKCVRVRLVIIGILGESPPTNNTVIPTLIKMLEVKDVEEYDVYVTAKQTLTSFRSAAIPSLIAAATDGQRDTITRCTAIEILGDINRQTKVVVSTLIELLRTRDERIQRSTVIALSRMGPVAQDAVKPLVRAAAKTKTNWLRTFIANALYSIDRGNRDAIKILRDSLVNGNSIERSHAAQVTSRMGRDASPLTPALITLLDDPSTLARWRAIWALQSIGPDAKAAIPALRKAKHGASEQTRKYIEEALASIEG
jgi:HEAT repeat protein